VIYCPSLYPLRVLRALERLKHGGQGNGRVAKLETGEENNYNMAVFVLTDARAPKQEEQPTRGAQLVLSAWAALCKHVRVEVVVREQGRVRPTLSTGRCQDDLGGTCRQSRVIDIVVDAEHVDDVTHRSDGRASNQAGYEGRFQASPVGRRRG